MASGITKGKDRPVPYKQIQALSAADFVASSDLPAGVPFIDPSRYTGGQAGAILKLWRNRQTRGEIPFKFEAVIGADKTLDCTDYPDGIFGNLKEPNGRPIPTRCSIPEAPVDEVDESEEDDEFQLPRAAWGMDEVEEERVEQTGQTNGADWATPGTSQENEPVEKRQPKGRIQKGRILVSEDEEPTTPNTQNLRGRTHRAAGDDEERQTVPAPIAPSSPAINPNSEAPTRKSRKTKTTAPVKKKRSKAGVIEVPMLATPEPSNPATPTPEGVGRQLRSRLTMDSKGTKTSKKSKK